MTARDDLYRLAARAGIDRDFVVDDRRDGDVSDEPLRAVLGAMGIAAATDADVAASLAVVSPMQDARAGGAADGVACHMPDWLAERPLLGRRLPALRPPLRRGTGGSAISRISADSPRSPRRRAPISSASIRSTPCSSPRRSAAARSFRRAGGSSTRSTSPSTRCRAPTARRRARHSRRRSGRAN